MPIVASETGQEKFDPNKHRGTIEDVLYGDYYFSYKESAKGSMERAIGDHQRENSWPKYTNPTYPMGY